MKTVNHLQWPQGARQDMCPLKMNNFKMNVNLKNNNHNTNQPQTLGYNEKTPGRLYKINFANWNIRLLTKYVTKMQFFIIQLQNNFTVCVIMIMASDTHIIE